MIDLVSETERVAVSLGLTDAVIRQLRARGHLARLELSERQIRERLWRGHLMSLHAEVSSGT